MYDKETDKELNNYEVWMSVSYKVRIFVAAENEKAIREEINEEEALKCIDSYGEQARQDFKMFVSPETNYNPPIFRQPIEDFNNGDWDHSL